MDDHRAEIHHIQRAAKAHEKAAQNKDPILRRQHRQHTAGDDEPGTQPDRLFGEQLDQNAGGHKVADDFCNGNGVGDKRCRSKCLQLKIIHDLRRKRTAGDPVDRKKRVSKKHNRFNQYGPA